MFFGKSARAEYNTVGPVTHPYKLGSSGTCQGVAFVGCLCKCGRGEVGKKSKVLTSAIVRPVLNLIRIRACCEDSYCEGRLLGAL